MIVNDTAKLENPDIRLPQFLGVAQLVQVLLVLLSGAACSLTAMLLLGCFETIRWGWPATGLMVSIRPNMEARLSCSRARFCHRGARMADTGPLRDPAYRAPMPTVLRRIAEPATPSRPKLSPNSARPSASQLRPRGHRMMPVWT